MAKSGLRRRNGLGTLATVALLLILSAAIRVSEHAGFAVAREADVTEAMNADAVPQQTDEINAVLDALSDREARVSESERQVRLRMVALEEAELEIAMKLDQLQAAERALRNTLALADEAAENDIARLTRVYENMKPKDAAELFETMDPQFASGFLGRMKPEAAAGILAGLSPEVAYAVSAVLAGRNAQVPTE